MSLKLSDKQREFLSAAAEREDGLLAIPPQLRGATAQKVGRSWSPLVWRRKSKRRAAGPFGVATPRPNRRTRSSSRPPA